jgi:hypothetical protein
MPLQLNWQSKRGPRGGRPKQRWGSTAAEPAPRLNCRMVSSAAAAAFHDTSSITGAHAAAGIGFGAASAAHADWTGRGSGRCTGRERNASREAFHFGSLRLKRTWAGRASFSRYACRLHRHLPLGFCLLR